MRRQNVNWKSIKQICTRNVGGNYFQLLPRRRCCCCCCSSRKRWQWNVMEHLRLNSINFLPRVDRFTWLSLVVAFCNDFHAIWISIKWCSINYKLQRETIKLAIGDDDFTASRQWQRLLIPQPPPDELLHGGGSGKLRWHTADWSAPVEMQANTLSIPVFVVRIEYLYTLMQFLSVQQRRRRRRRWTDRPLSMCLPWGGVNRYIGISHSSKLYLEYEWESQFSTCKLFNCETYSDIDKEVIRVEC